MKQLKFKYARAENFVCFGPDGVDVDFASFGNIVRVSGTIVDGFDKTTSNGSGKTTLAEIPVYALFGRSVKEPTKISHGDLINHDAGKKMSVEFRWDDYRVVRTRKPDGLRLWHSPEGIWDKSTEITRGGMPATQKHLEEILGLTYDTFINVYIFSDDNTRSFLRCDTAAKRDIVENLLSLDRYRDYSKSAREMSREGKEAVKALAREYELVQEEYRRCRDRGAELEKQTVEWRQAREAEHHKLQQAIEVKKRELEKCSASGEALLVYQEAQEKVAVLKASLPEKEERLNKLRNFLTEVEAKQKKIATEYATAAAALYQAGREFVLHKEKVESNEKILADNEAKDGQPCPYCYTVMTSSQFADVINKARKVLEDEIPLLMSAKAKVDELEPAVKSLDAQKLKLDKGVVECKGKISQAESDLSTCHFQITELSKVQMPQTGAQEALLGQQIEQLQNLAKAKEAEKNGPSPFDGFKLKLAAEMQEIFLKSEEKKQRLQEAEADVPYCDYWVQAFGDSGIRKYVIDGIIPALNSRIAYWLQFLTGGMIKLEFDNELEATIDRFPFQGQPYLYHLMSGAQRRHLNLAVSQAFAHIMEMNTGCSPSVVFLDEVTANMDEVGAEGIYRMICEMSRHKQVFVIDHKESLLRHLDGCDKINLEMRDGVTKKV